MVAPKPGRISKPDPVAQMLATLAAQPGLPSADAGELPEDVRAFLGQAGIAELQAVLVEALARLHLLTPPTRPAAD
ncbi:MAG: hypothetical protein AAF612_04190 [Planctomycetota bacterium]